MEIAYFINFTSNGDTRDSIESRPANLSQTAQVPAPSAPVARIRPRSFRIHPRFTQRRDKKLTCSGQSFDFAVTSSAPRTLTVITRATAFNSTREEHHGQNEELDESHSKSPVAIDEGHDGRGSHGRRWAVGRGKGRIRREQLKQPQQG